MRVSTAFLAAWLLGLSFYLNAVWASTPSGVAPPPPEADRSMPYYDRHKIDVSNLRDFYEGLLTADVMIHADAMFDAKTKWKMTLYQMILARSNHNQARSAYQLSLMDVPMDEIRSLWLPDYVASIKDARLRTAFEYIQIAATYPIRVTADTHAALRTHFIDRQIAELFELAAVNAAIATYDHILPIPTDQKTVDWATENLGPVGWKVGLNKSSNSKEQRARLFAGDALTTARSEIISTWKPEDLGAVAPVFKTDWVNYITGYGVSRVTFDGDRDGIEEPFDSYPQEYLRWKKPGSNDENNPKPSIPPFKITAYDYQYYRPPVMSKTKYSFSDRHRFDTEWTRESSLGVIKMDEYFSGSDRTLGLAMKWSIFFVQQLASGCVHCQVHGAYGIYDAIKDDYLHNKLPPEELPGVLAKIHALLDFERSDLHTDAEKAIFRLARDAGRIPTRTTAAHIEELRRHFSDREIQEVISLIVTSAWLSTVMQSQVTVTDRLSMSWALRHLAPVGWKPGAHFGLPNEQRPYHMTELRDRGLAKMNSGEVMDSSSEWVGIKVPLAVDKDGDGVDDTFDGFPDDPTRWEDTDRDGIEDKMDDDIDGDGIPNRKEVSLGTFPYKADSDGDGVDDATEIKAGTDPVDPRSL
ncbi:MAG: hypothetical protein AAF732_14005 [Pseudomonadota bacterium]